ncbi:ABC transporter permease [Aureibacter tunicatorum]|uniref:ABC-type lipoprotein release transport system permease subunit n=1 Tax=Aureibacter tunicatorum TaxID=866807 RepID=A0AAE3XIM8_9BACT|nr:FtsX-like permease family protein [Aureibacter tunicatorum]MDR6238431.1 ABC-type lipoprotein release transport system permease subunit [Aureibacter tunicatorum]BDD03463.1 ABC transporter permease [Aureibacter tunicatorum]
MTIMISWRNVWRNKIRSITIMAAIAIGLFGSILLDGFMNGMMNQSVKGAWENELSHIQIHNKRYLMDENVQDYIPKVEGIESILSSMHEVVSYSSRVKASGMLSSAEGNVGVIAYGIDAENEPRVTGLHKKIVDGVYLSNDQSIPIIIGKKLADQLTARVKSRLVLGLVKADGEITYGAFRVVGIFDNQKDAFDGVNVFVNQDDLLALLEMPRSNSITEIALRLLDESEKDKVKAKLSGTIDDQSVVVRTWNEIDPLLETQRDMSAMFGAIFVAIILIALIFGVVNTMMMVIMERKKELGMLKAIGMKPFKVCLMIVWETVFLSITGAVVGIAFGAMVSQYFSRVGFDLSMFGDGMAYVGYDTMIYPEVTIGFLVFTGIAVVVMAVLASLYPAYNVVRLKPADSLRS